MEAIADLDESDQLAAFWNIVNYGLDGTEPETRGAATAIFKMAKPQIDANNTRYQNGTRGGRKAAPRETEEPKPNQTGTKTEPKPNQTGTKPEPNVNVNVNVNENENENEKKKDIVGQAATEYPYKAVIDYLNRKAGTAFKDRSKDSRRHIKARFDDGFCLDDFYNVIDKKTAEWQGTDLAPYLRPSTLFGAKFEAYLNQPPAIAKKGKVIPDGNRFHNFTQRETDYDALVAQINGF